MVLKIKSYKENKIDIKNDEESKIEKEKDIDKDKKNNDEEKENEEKKEEEIKDLPNIKFGDEIINKLLNVKEIIKKGENIELYVDIPKTFEEETIQICSVLELESSSGLKLELKVNIILTIIPISVLISCREYKLIKQKINYDSNITFEQCFKLDSTEFKGDEEINFDLANYNTSDSIEFFLSLKSLKNNTSNKPSILTIKQKNNFKITIPKYYYNSNENEIPRLNCILEVYINKNFVIYILIDALIRPNINIIKMYDFYSKDYVENESTIYFSESSQNIFKRDNRYIELNFILFSTLENTSFKVTPNYFYGGNIEPYEGNLENGKCEFKLKLKFSENEIIKNTISCRIDISLNMEKLYFEIKFVKAPESIFSNADYNFFGIKGKNEIQENWIR